MFPEPPCPATSHLDLGFIRTLVLGRGGQGELPSRELYSVRWGRGGALLGKRSSFPGGLQRPFKPWKWLTLPESQALLLPCGLSEL